MPKLKHMKCQEFRCEECPFRRLVCSAHYTYTIEEVLEQTYKRTLTDKYPMPKKVYEGYKELLEKEVEVNE